MGIVFSSLASKSNLVKSPMRMLLSSAPRHTQGGIVPPGGHSDCGAIGINASNVAVGICRVISFPSPPASYCCALLWHPSGGAVNLQGTIDASTGWHLTTALSISNGGHIVGAGVHNGQARAFLLTPLPVTEPSAITMHLNQADFCRGDTLEIPVEREGGPADLHVAIILPDGVTTLFLTNLERLSYIVSTIEAGPYPLTGGSSLTHTWRGLEPDGLYHMVAALGRPGGLADGRIDAGDLLGLDWKAFSFSPGELFAGRYAH